MRQGFTLIELLIIIAIIGILSTVTVVNLCIAKSQAVDARVINEFQQLEKALEFYYLTYGVYPCGQNDIISDDEHSQAYPPGYTVDHAADDYAFLLGDIDDPQEAAVCGANNAPREGLQLLEMIEDDVSKNINHPLWKPYNAWASWPWNYVYIVDGDRQSYTLHTVLVVSDDIMENDGGSCDNFYEVGNGIADIEPWVAVFNTNQPGLLSCD